jgi:hypothetical protein
MFLSRAGAVDAATATARRSWTAAAQDRIVSEIRGTDDRRQNEKKDHRVHQ